jgi:amino acid adenylation domain-containing protein
VLGKISEIFFRFPNRNAFCINSEYYTYYTFAKLVSKIRNYIQSNLDSSEKIIGVIANPEPEIETYGAIYGSLYSGRGYVPLNPMNPIQRNLEILEQSGIKTILCRKTNEKLNELAHKLRINIIEISSLSETHINIELPNVDENEIAYILFTSGSTGTPKGVPITRKNLNSFIHAFYNLNLDVNENDRFLQMFELTFDFSVVCYTIPLCLGACIYTVPTEGIKFANIFSTLEENEITFACMVPTVLNYLKPYFEEIKLNKMKYSLFCGEILYADIVKEWSNCTPNAIIINAYGPTEATVFCMTYNWDNKTSNKTYNGSVAIGKPMENINAIVIDENLKKIKTGAKGELCLSGNQLTNGYLNDSKKNEQSFFTFNIDGKEKIFYRTGDLAFVDKEGDFLFAGRKDNQIKIQGFRIELSEIEYFAREFTKVINVKAISSIDKRGVTQIHLFVENYSGNIEDIQSYLLTKVPGYMIPSSITILKVFPLNGNGKVDKKKLISLTNKN